VWGSGGNECAGELFREARQVRYPFLVEKKYYIILYNQVKAVHFQTKNRDVMEQQNSGKRVLDSFERAKLGLKVFSMPFAEAEEVIDDYVSQGDYDPACVELFKDQLDTQRHIQEKSVELLSTGAQILRLVVGAFIKNIPHSSSEESSTS
jgi:hypothetical protein